MIKLSNSNALTYTRDLRKVINQLDTIYEESRLNRKEYDFYTEIEPFVNEVNLLTKNWRNAINQVISESTSYFVGERQLDQVEDNITKLSVQAFQYTASYKLFKSYLQSTKFLLTTIERQL